MDGVDIDQFLIKDPLLGISYNPENVTDVFEYRSWHEAAQHIASLLSEVEDRELEKVEITSEYVDVISTTFQFNQSLPKDFWDKILIWRNIITDDDEYILALEPYSPEKVMSSVTTSDKFFFYGTDVTTGFYGIDDGTSIPEYATIYEPKLQGNWIIGDNKIFIFQTEENAASFFQRLPVRHKN